jgi:hypothetical protein
MTNIIENFLELKETEALEEFEESYEKLLDTVLMNVDSETVKGSIDGIFDYALSKRDKARLENSLYPFKKLGLTEGRL